MKQAKIKRATLGQEALGIRPILTRILPLMSVNDNWYPSIYFEKKTSRTISLNLKQTSVSDATNAGVVLRMFDGFSLFEQACQSLDEPSIKSAAEKLILRVGRSSSRRSKLQPTFYHPLPWQMKLKNQKLTSEILEQIPRNPKPKTPIHFGVQYEQNPKTIKTDKVVITLKNILERCKKFAPDCGLTDSDLTFLLARESFSTEESIFIDKETNISQTLFRPSLTFLAMAGADRAYERLGGLGGREIINLTDEQIKRVLQDLKSLKTADKLKPGKYQVLCGPIVTGVLAHEAFGHSQEGDTCARGRSKAWDLYKTKARVGNQHATIVNNPAAFQNGDAPGAAWGSYFFDEEGWLAEEHVLLKNGILQTPMTNLTSSIRLGVPRTANGKRESWANGVYVRQTNTYFTPGKKTLDEMIKLIKKGFLALHPAGGMEDPKGMGIQVGISYLHEIKNGKFTGRIFKGPAGGDIQMTGYVPNVLNSIVAKSKISAESKSADNAKTPFNDAGGCGKYHKEFVNAGCGGTYILLDEVTLG